MNSNDDNNVSLQQGYEWLKTMIYLKGEGGRL